MFCQNWAPVIMTLKKCVWDEYISKCVGKGREKARKAAKLKKHKHLLMYSRNLPNSSYTPLMF